MRDPTFSHFHTTPMCNKHTHRQKDGRTDRHTTTAWTALSIATLGKNWQHCTAHQVQLPGNERRL